MDKGEVEKIKSSREVELLFIQQICRCLGRSASSTLNIFVDSRDSVGLTLLRVGYFERMVLRHRV